MEMWEGQLFLTTQPSPQPGRNPRNAASPSGSSQPSKARLGAWDGCEALGHLALRYCSVGCLDRHTASTLVTARVPKEREGFLGWSPLWADPSMPSASFIECQSCTGHLPTELA